MHVETYSRVAAIPIMGGIPIIISPHTLHQTKRIHDTMRRSKPSTFYKQTSHQARITIVSSRTLFYSRLGAA